MSRRNYRHNTMDALIGKPLYSNVMGDPTTSVDVVGGGTLSGNVFTPPSDTGNTGVSGTASTSPTYSGSRDNATPLNTVIAETTFTGVRDNAIPISTTTFTPDSIDTSKPIKTGTTTTSTGAGTTTATAPIIPIIVTPTPIVTPLVSGGGFGGGGGASSSGKSVTEKPNFIKKNIIPILLAGSAIYVLIKKPI
jgi:hypothetical protein